MGREPGMQAGPREGRKGSAGGHGTQAQPGGATGGPRASERMNLDPSNCPEAGAASAGPLRGGEVMERRTQADFLRALRKAISRIC